MDTNESLRQRAIKLIDLGVTQKVIAGKMGMAPSTFSKWLNEVEGINPPSVAALDRFNRYVKQLCSEAQADPRTMTDDEQERATASKMIHKTEHAQQQKARAIARKRGHRGPGKELAGK